MANQSPDRRQVLEMLAKAAAASQFPGFSRWAFAYKQQPTVITPRAANYHPQFFTTSEYHTIALLTELIIPKDDTPGAKDAGVSEFIDFMAAHGEAPLQKQMRPGLVWLDATAKKEYSAAFEKLSADQQTALLSKVAYRASATHPDAEGVAFFRLIRRYTVMGYYTSRVGLEELDFPGLKMYTQSPACPHTNDPEHRHLPPPRF